MWKLYEYITRHFLGTLLPNGKYEQTDVSIEIGSETFTCTGNRWLEPGFTKAMHWKEIENVMRLNQDLKEGMSVKVLDVKQRESQTTPPPYLSESDLHII